MSLSFQPSSLRGFSDGYLCSRACRSVTWSSACLLRPSAWLSMTRILAICSGESSTCSSYSSTVSRSISVGPAFGVSPSACFPYRVLPDVQPCRCHLLSRFCPVAMRVRLPVLPCSRVVRRVQVLHTLRFRWRAALPRCMSPAHIGLSSSVLACVCAGFSRYGASSNGPCGSGVAVVSRPSARAGRIAQQVRSRSVEQFKIPHYLRKSPRPRRGGRVRGMAEHS